MIRAALLLLIIGVGVTVDRHTAPPAWPFRATVTDLHGQAVSFSGMTRGGELIIQVGRSSVRALARNDTLRATTPAQYPLDLRRGPVVFFTGNRDSIRVVVGRNPGATDQVTAQGQRLTVRLANGRAVIDAR